MVGHRSLAQACVDLIVLFFVYGIGQSRQSNRTVYQLNILVLVCGGGQSWQSNRTVY